MGENENESTVHWTYERQYRKCGRAWCWCAEVDTKETGHGPYWYGYRRVGKKIVSKYFGIKMPPGALAAEKKKIAMLRKISGMLAATSMRYEDE